VRSRLGWYAGSPSHPTSPRTTGRRSPPCRVRRKATLLSGSSPRVRCKGTRRHGPSHVHQRPPCARLTLHSALLGPDFSRFNGFFLILSFVHQVC
jgi:hypothetical protein